jgi:hypothetical protein
MTHTAEQWAERNKESLREAWSEIDRLKSINDDLLAALEGVMGLIDRGWLVRNTEDDGKPEFFIRMLKPFMMLQSATAAIARAKGEA